MESPSVVPWLKKYEQANSLFVLFKDDFKNKNYFDALVKIEVMKEILQDILENYSKLPPTISNEYKFLEEYEKRIKKIIKNQYNNSRLTTSKYTSESIRE